MLKKEKVDAHRRGHARGPDRDRLGQASRPQVQLADQGQIGQLGGPPAARKPDRRQAQRMARGKSGARADDHPEDHRRRRGARSGAQGARPHPAQGRDGYRLAAREARRLPGARSGAQRAVPGRGRQRRRLGQAGPQPPKPGDPPAPRQAPQRRARALRPDALVEGNRDVDPGARHRRSARIGTSPSCAITRS